MKWLTWTTLWPALSGIPGWIGFALSLRRTWLERTILKFSISTGSIEASAGDPIMRTAPDGAPLVEAVHVIVTNNGMRPLTITSFFCEYSTLSREGFSPVQRAYLRNIDQKIGQGDACSGNIKFASKPTGILGIKTVDSTDKQWSARAEQVSELSRDAIERGQWDFPIWP